MEIRPVGAVSSHVAVDVREVVVVGEEVVRICVGEKGSSRVVALPKNPIVPLQYRITRGGVSEA